MKITITLHRLLLAVFLMLSTSAFAQNYYAKSGNGINLRTGPGTGYPVVSTVPFNGQVKYLSDADESWIRVDYHGQRGYVHRSYLSEEENKAQQTSTQRQNSNTQSRNNNNYQRNTQQRRNNTRNYTSRRYGYTTALGLRGGFTSGVSLKHFVNNNGALEFVLGSRWHGVSLTGMYQWHKPNALEVPGLSWEYGLGARVGFYDGRYYYRHYYKKPCNNPNNPNCYSYYSHREPGIRAVGLVGIGGLEYQFPSVPLTFSIDLMPHMYLPHYWGTFWDGSVSLRYVFK
ncbi:SH3 domain-containing protein [Litoribacter populi]|uniref:SH3 domain-containing protein n=1 Tax=Litoribacter populi TaxID=2598460 RepID=UPI00163DBBA9|nr:SH3 domain-containing protein [Litoribacter populi]